MKAPFHAEAAFFCFAWVGVAVLAAFLIDWRAGLVLSVGLFPIIMPASAWVLSRTGDFKRERQTRWSILAVAAAAMVVFADVWR